MEDFPEWLGSIGSSRESSPEEFLVPIKDVSPMKLNPVNIMPMELGNLVLKVEQLQNVKGSKFSII